MNFRYVRDAELCCGSTPFRIRCKQLSLSSIAVLPSLEVINITNISDRPDNPKTKNNSDGKDIVRSKETASPTASIPPNHTSTLYPNVKHIVLHLDDEGSPVFQSRTPKKLLDFFHTSCPKLQSLRVETVSNISIPEKADITPALIMRGFSLGKMLREVGRMKAVADLLLHQKEYPFEIESAIQLPVPSVKDRLLKPMNGVGESSGSTVETSVSYTFDHAEGSRKLSLGNVSLISKDKRGYKDIFGVRS